MKFYMIGIVFLLAGLPVMGQSTAAVVVLDEPGFPFIFELDPGDSMTVSRNYQGRNITKTVKLVSYRTFTEPNLWFSEMTKPENYYQAEVQLEVDGHPVQLYHRPYQMPATFEGLRIFIENIKVWHESAGYGGRGRLTKEVRIAICAENEPWGPEYIEFPVNNYIWRGAVYNNTWSGLVPFNQLYYHRGEDYGAIPDRLDVVAMLDGVVGDTPVPGDSAIGSNRVHIVNDLGLRCGYSHMNIETIRPEYPAGTRISAGTVIGKTGMTWNGGRNQHMDPHLHVDLSMNQISLASFPYMMEAYLRKYPDPVIAIAGGYRFTVTGHTVELDAGRSFSRDGQSLNYRWKLSNGLVSEQEKVNIMYKNPGIYAEELQVLSSDGHTDRDFLYVKVYSPGDTRDFAFGWAYYYPFRGNKPGDEIIFWNRLACTTEEVKINYGDSQEWYPIQEETTHTYSHPGKYVVTLRSSGLPDQPISLKMEVIIE